MHGGGDKEGSCNLCRTGEIVCNVRQFHCFGQLDGLDNSTVRTTQQFGKLNGSDNSTVKTTPRLGQYRGSENSTGKTTPRFGKIRYNSKVWTTMVQKT